MSITGKSSLSIKKQDLAGQKTGATSFRKIMFAHKAVAGETVINLMDLTTPTELSASGFIQPTPSLLAAANLRFFRNNLTLVSSVRGALQDFISYNVSSSTSIVFTDDFGSALDGEIFTGIIDAVPRNDLVGIDSTSILATGTLAATASQFNVGSSYKVNANPSTQIGEIAVYLDGAIQFRNTGNATANPSADGNYQEIDNGSGYGTLIQFNDVDPVNARAVMVIGTGISVIRPNGSLVQELELLSGQIDAMVPTLAAVAGVPESTFQSAPTNADLKAFGDRVLDLELTKANIDADNTWTAAQSLIGVVDGSSASAGEIGEFVFSEAGSGQSLTNDQYNDGNVTSGLTLQPGEWDIRASSEFASASASTWTRVVLAIGTVSGNSGTGVDTLVNGLRLRDASSTTTLGSTEGVMVLHSPMWRVRISVPTTYYPKTLVNFSGSAMTSRSRIEARRVR